MTDLHSALKGLVETWREPLDFAEPIDKEWGYGYINARKKCADQLAALISAQEGTVAPKETCPECGGSGKMLDAPDRVLNGRPYWTACDECGGTGSLKAPPATNWSDDEAQVAASTQARATEANTKEPTSDL